MQAEGSMKFSKAEGYERYLGPWSSALAPRFIDFAGVRDGDRVLDVGSGIGSLALALAASRSCSEVVGIDPSAPYIEFARRRTTEPHVRFDVGDAGLGLGEFPRAPLQRLRDAAGPVLPIRAGLSFLRIFRRSRPRVRNHWGDPMA